MYTATFIRLYKNGVGTFKENYFYIFSHTLKYFQFKLRTVSAYILLISFLNEILSQNKYNSRNVPAYIHNLHMLISTCNNMYT